MDERADLMMRIVLDTNVFLTSVSRKSISNWLLQDSLNGQIELCITNEILTEYEEVLTSHWNATVAQAIFHSLLKAETVQRINFFFRFNLIPFDQDDNKFVDCYVASNADYLVSNDSHFSILKHIPFPPVRVLIFSDFEQLYRNQNSIEP